MKFQSDVITSRQNPFVVFAASLADKKRRDEAGLFMAEGEKLTEEALKAELPIAHIVVAESRKNRAEEILAPYKEKPCFSNTTVIFVKDGVFEKISTEKSPQGVISFIKHLDFFETCNIIIDVDFFQNSGERMLLLAGVRDPGNLGAIIRSAVAFGIDRVLLTDDTVDLYNPKTVRSAMGSLFHIRSLRVKDTVSLIRALQNAGRRVLAAELRDGALPIAEVKPTAADVVVIGNEGHGIDEKISSVCDASVYLPISEYAESLNAAVAAAIFMWEQR